MSCGTETTGEVKVAPVNIELKGRHVLLVEDIVDTGLTLEALKGQGFTLVPISAHLELTLPLSAQLKLTLSPIQPKSTRGCTPKVLKFSPHVSDVLPKVLKFS